MADIVIEVDNEQELDVVAAGFPAAAWARKNDKYCVMLTSLFDIGGKRLVILVKIRGRACKFG